MTGVFVAPGDAVAAGQRVASVAVMKMETDVTAPRAGAVADVLVREGDLVAKGAPLLVVDTGANAAKGGNPAAASAARAPTAGESKSDEGWLPEVAELARRAEAARGMGGAAAVAKHRARGRLTVRDRVNALLDAGSFREVGVGAGAADGGDGGGFAPANFVLGEGEVNGRAVVVGGEDFTVKGGSPTAAGLRKSVYTEQLALTLGVPLVRLHEGAGGAVGGQAAKKGAAGGPAGAPVFEEPRFASVAQCLASVPVASAALGAVAGLPAARLVASHFSVMHASAQVLTAGPAVVARALGYHATKDALGGAALHRRSGVVDNIVQDERACFDAIRRWLSYLPSRAGDAPPRAAAPAPAADDPPARADDWLVRAVPRDRRRGFDVRRVLRCVVDADPGAPDGHASSFFEIGAGVEYGGDQVTGFARLGGHSVGVTANDGGVGGGAMTADGARKFRRFVETCQTFGLPIVALCDEPGFMIGIEAEEAGTIRAGTAAVMAAHTCAVPWATVVVRKAYGVAAMSHFGGRDTTVLAWPSAEVGTLPVESGVAVAFGREIAASDDPEALRAELEAKFAAALSPFPRAESFCFHELIDPRETRARLCAWAGRAAPRAVEAAAAAGAARFPVRP